MLNVAVALTSVLVPGVGHAIAGFDRRGAAWLAITLVVHGLAVVTVWAVFAMLLLRIACAIDAVICTRARRSPTGWAPSVGLAIGAIAGIVVLRFGFVEAFKIPASSMTPTLLVGDHILVDKLTRLWRSPARGDIVVFQQPCTPSHDYVKRVVASGGDTVEVRCGVLYVNGKAVPSSPVAGTCRYDDRFDLEERWESRSCSRYHETLDGVGYDVVHDVDHPGRAGQPDDRDFPQLEAITPPSCATGELRYGEAPLAQPLGSLVRRSGIAGACEPQLHYVVPPDALFMLGDNRANSNDSRYWGVVPTHLVKGRVTGIWYSPGPNGQRWSRTGGIE